MVRETLAKQQSMADCKTSQESGIQINSWKMIQKSAFPQDGQLTPRQVDIPCDDGSEAQPSRGIRANTGARAPTHLFKDSTISWSSSSPPGWSAIRTLLSLHCDSSVSAGSKAGHPGSMACSCRKEAAGLAGAEAEDRHTVRGDQGAPKGEQEYRVRAEAGLGTRHGAHQPALAGSREISTTSDGCCWSDPRKKASGDSRQGQSY